MTLNYFFASVILGCSALWGRGLAACFLGLFPAHNSERIFPQMDVGLFRHSMLFLQPRHSLREGLARAILRQFFKRVIWKCHSSCATAVFRWGKKIRGKKKKTTAVWDKWPSVQTNLYFIISGQFFTTVATFMCQETKRNCLEKTAGLHFKIQIYNK